MKVCVVAVDFQLLRDSSGLEIFRWRDGEVKYAART